MTPSEKNHSAKTRKWWKPVAARILGTRLKNLFAPNKQEYIEEHKQYGETMWCGNYRYVRVGLRRSRTLNGSYVK